MSLGKPGYVMVKPDNHKSEEEIPCDRILPCWSMNPDLKALAESPAAPPEPAGLFGPPAGAQEEKTEADEMTPEPASEPAAPALPEPAVCGEVRPEPPPAVAVPKQTIQFDPVNGGNIGDMIDDIQLLNNRIKEVAEACALLQSARRDRDAIAAKLAPFGISVAGSDGGQEAPAVVSPVSRKDAELEVGAAASCHSCKLLRVSAKSSNLDSAKRRLRKYVRALAGAGVHLRIALVDLLRTVNIEASNTVLFENCLRGMDDVIYIPLGGGGERIKVLRLAVVIHPTAEEREASVY